MVNKFLAVVVVTYNRLELLKQGIKSLENQSLLPDSVIVINNASTDGVTQYYLDEYTGVLSLDVIHSQKNTGGAGGFYKGIKHAYEQGFEWVFVMDDDVLMGADCLKQMVKVSHPCMLAVREDKNGKIVERACLSYDFNNPFLINPKGKMLCDIYQNREDMPETIDVQSSAFEGFMIHKEVIAKIGYPNPNYFILYDDLDYVLRAILNGYTIKAVRNAVLIRQLPFNPQDAVLSWKAYYAFRNFFYIHYKFGGNWLVKNKPYILAIAAMLVYGLKYRKLQVIKDIYRALRDYKMIND